MELHKLATSLGLRSLPIEWLEFAGQEDTSGSESELTERAVESWCHDLSAPTSVVEALRSHLALMRDIPGLGSLFRACRRLLYVDGGIEAIRHWPLFDDQLLPGGNMFYVYLFLAGRDALRRRHGARGIAPEISDTTLSDVFVWMQDYHTKHGQWGLSALGWVGSYVLTDRLIQLGRLQYNFGTFTAPFCALEHVDGRQVVFLAEDGQHFRSDGQFEGANRQLDANGPWTSTLQIDADWIRGFVVHPDGHVLPEPRTFSARKWHVVLRQGDPALCVHIPATGPLAPDACRQSLLDAISFFPAHFPEKPFRALWCRSWLMDSQLKACLPVSNVASFLNEFYLLPWANTSDRQTMERVFGSETVDLRCVEPTTSLQHAILDHIRQGGVWRCQAGVILPRAYPPGDSGYRNADWQVPGGDDE